MQTTLGGVQNAFQMAGGSAGLSALFLAGLLALWHYKSENKLEVKAEINDLFWYALIMLIVITNPLYIWIINRFYPELLNNNMFLWGLPVVLVVVYVAVVVISRLDNGFKKTVFTIGLLGIIFLATTTSYNQNEFRLVQNNEYVNDHEIKTFEALSDYMASQNRENILIWGPDEIMKDARIFDARIMTLYGKDLFEGQINSQMQEIYDEWYGLAYVRMQAGASKLSDIVIMAVSKNCDAIILKTESFNNSELEIPHVIDMTYYLLYSDEYYCVYVKNN